MRQVSWCPTVKRIVRRSPASGQIDLSVTGETHRAYAHSSAAVIGRAPPQRPEKEDLLTLALTSRSRDRWRDEQAALTKAFAAAYGCAGGGVSGKQRELGNEAEVKTDEVRAVTEYIPRVRETVRALQETRRLKQLASLNPRLQKVGEAAKARDDLNERHEEAIHRLQAAARGLSARREAKTKLSNYRARTAVNAAAQRAGLNVRVVERV